METYQVSESEVDGLPHRGYSPLFLFRIDVDPRKKNIGTRRQEDDEVGSAFDGSAGVDSEDIMNIPEIGYSTFQFFPDQNTYIQGPADSGLSSFQNVLQEGLGLDPTSSRTELHVSAVFLVQYSKTEKRGADLGSQ